MSRHQQKRFGLMSLRALEAQETLEEGVARKPLRDYLAGPKRARTGSPMKPPRPEVPEEA